MNFSNLLFFIFLAVSLISASCSKSESEKKVPLIINAHEHIQSVQEIPRFFEVMEGIGVQRTVVLGSPHATFVYGADGFYDEDKNNQQILEMARDYPSQIIAFPTINVKDPQKLERLKDYLTQGGKGLKLYSGNTVFYNQPLDDSSMIPIYEFCQANRVPILFHVNAGRYLKEFENVLKRFPKMKVICPHFCLSSIDLQRLEHLLDTYPQLYTDISFGYITHLIAGLERISKNPEKYRAFMQKYQDRIFFGTDLVVTEDKAVDRLIEIGKVYRDFLERETYTFFAVPDIVFNGLHLEQGILEKIYFQNFEKFMQDDS